MKALASRLNFGVPIWYQDVRSGYKLGTRQIQSELVIGGCTRVINLLRILTNPDEDVVCTIEPGIMPQEVQANEWARKQL